MALRGGRKPPAFKGRLARYLAGMSDAHDAIVAARFAKACEQARAHLLRLMEQRGLRARDGWKIVETVRQGPGGTELVMRPLHLRIAAPPDLECVVGVDADSTAVDSSCSP